MNNDAITFTLRRCAVERNLILSFVQYILTNSTIYKLYIDSNKRLKAEAYNSYKIYLESLCFLKVKRIPKV